MTRRLFTNLKNRAMDHGISSIVDEAEFGGKDRAAKWLMKAEASQTNKKSKSKKKSKDLIKTRSKLLPVKEAV